MLQMGAIIGGEESGGTGFGHFLPERDALLMSLLLLQARRRSGLRLCEMVDDLYQRYGRPYFVHYDLALPAGVSPLDFKPRIRELSSLNELAGEQIASFNHRDGMKLRFAGGWLLARASGTEPLVRIYSESSTMGQAKAQARAAMDFLGLGQLRPDEH
jgi:phosphomannomutase